MTRRHQVFITDFIDDHLAPEREIFGELADVRALNAMSEDELFRRAELPDADALIAFHMVKVSARVIERLRHCRIIARGGVGVDNVDLPTARRLQIPVVNVPDYGTEEVADTAIGMLLALTRGITFLNSRLRRGLEPWTYLQASPVYRLRGRTIGIVGLGRIGTATVLRARALGMHVLFYDPYLPDGYDKALGIGRCETLEELCRNAHVLSLHCPLTDETRHLIGEEQIRALPAGAFLVNTARGAIIDTRAIAPALASGQLAGVGLDVLPQEPPLADDPLLVAWRDPSHPAHDRLIINPHAAFYCEEGLLEMRTKAAISCRRALLGLPLRNVVS